jgi:hypothetical protein
VVCGEIWHDRCFRYAMMQLHGGPMKTGAGTARGCACTRGKPTIACRPSRLFQAQPHEEVRTELKPLSPHPLAAISGRVTAVSQSALRGLSGGSGDRDVRTHKRGRSNGSAFRTSTTLGRHS